MSDETDKLIGYAPVPFPPWIRQRAALMRKYLFELGVQRSASEYCGLDDAILLLTGELLLPEMSLAVVGPLPDEELVLVHLETDVGPKPAKSWTRLVRALGVAPPDGILSIRGGLPWILTSFKGASIAARLGYITIPIADIKRVVGPPPS